MLLILLGGPVTVLNWTTGEMHTNEFTVLLLGAGWFRASVYGPVILQVAFPIGAAIFLARRYQLILQARHTKIGRASCRERCRARWSPYHSKKKQEREEWVDAMAVSAADAD